MVTKFYPLREADYFWTSALVPMSAKGMSCTAHRLALLGDVHHPKAASADLIQQLRAMGVQSLGQAAGSTTSAAGAITFLTPMNAIGSYSPSQSGESMVHFKEQPQGKAALLRASSRNRGAGKIPTAAAREIENGLGFGSASGGLRVAPRLFSFRFAPAS